MEEENPFVGTWIAASGYHAVFTDNTVTVYNTSGNIYWKATYTYNDDRVLLTFDTALSHPEVLGSDWGQAGWAPYMFQDGYLYFNHVQLEKCNYVFTPLP